MSNTINDGGPAFPRPSVEITENDRNYGQTGMTLRDYFAGQALGTIIGDTRKHPTVTVEEDANTAYAYADAMLAAREARP